MCWPVNILDKLLRLSVVLQTLSCSQQQNDNSPRDEKPSLEQAQAVTRIPYERLNSDAGTNDGATPPDQAPDAANATDTPRLSGYPALAVASPSLALPYSDVDMLKQSISGSVSLAIATGTAVEVRMSEEHEIETLFKLSDVSILWGITPPALLTTQGGTLGDTTLEAAHA